MIEDDIALTISFGIVSTIGIVFNVLVIIVILKTSSLRTPMNYLLLNLAVSDIMISVFVLPRHVLFNVFDHQEGVRGDFLCKFLTGGTFIWIGATAEGYTLITIAVERFIAVAHPHDIKSRITNKKLKWIVPLCWGINSAVNAPSMAALSYNKTRNYCIETWSIALDPKAYVSFIFVVGISSVVVMFALYSIVICTLWRHKKSTVEASHNARLRMRKKVTRMLVIITVFHAICRLPNYIFYLLAYVLPGAIYGSLVYDITVLFILINSASHPFLLCLHLTSFRSGIKRLLSCRNTNTNTVNIVESTVQFNQGRILYQRQLKSDGGRVTLILTSVPL